MINWIIEDYLLKAKEIEEFKEIFERYNIKYNIVKRIPLAKTKEEAYQDGVPNVMNKDSKDIAIYYCTIGMAKQVNEWFNNKGLFYNEENFSCYNYYKNIDYKLLLNSQNLFLQYSQLLELWDDLFDYFKSNAIFIRPNSGDKIFVGDNYRQDMKEVFIEQANKYNKLKYDELCMISKCKAIKSEYRFVVVGKKIITYCKYKEYGMPVEQIIFNQKAYDLANKIAQQDWQIDKFYIIDIAELYDKTCYIIELNAGSCSGLYSCDKERIVLAINEMYNI